jgi:hypothetical protein
MAVDQGGKGARLPSWNSGCKSAPMGAVFRMFARRPVLLSGADDLGSNMQGEDV